jgi:hypothetical protein
MKTMDTTATVAEDNTLTVKVTRDIPPGEHCVVLVIDEDLASRRTKPLRPFPVISVGQWPDGPPLGREDMYGVPPSENSEI